MLVLPDDAGASAADLDRCRLAGAERRDHGVPVEGTRGAEAARSSGCVASRRRMCRCAPPRTN
jgi:hypothetical protein